MSGMFWIALELSVPKIGLNIMLPLTVKKLDVSKFDGVAESDNTGYTSHFMRVENIQLRRLSTLVRLRVLCLVSCARLSDGGWNTRGRKLNLSHLQCRVKKKKKKKKKSF